MRRILLTALCIITTIVSVNAKTYLLVHGSMTDGTVWYKLKALLEAKGHKVVAINLPGHGKDNTNASSVSYESYISVISDSVKAQAGKVILVGHSMAGLLIASVAEKLTIKIESLVFIAAFMPQSGNSVFELNATDKQSQFGPNLIVEGSNTSATMKLDMIATVFCSDCNMADKALLVLSHKAEPLAPLAEIISLSKEIYAQIPKFSIITLFDNAVGNELQQKLAANSENVKKVFKIKSGHLPFLSKPQKVASILLSL